MSKCIMVIGNAPSVAHIEAMAAAERGASKVQVVCCAPEPTQDPLMRMAGLYDFEDRGRGNKLKEPFGKSRKRRRA